MAEETAAEFSSIKRSFGEDTFTIKFQIPKHGKRDGYKGIIIESIWKIDIN
jgi:hypothetical protein